MTETVTAVEPAPVFDLDLEKIGAILRMLPAVSARIGHKSLQGTLLYGAALTPEEEFVRDIFALDTPQMIEKWYGGPRNAGRFAAEAWGAALAKVRKNAP